jgi:hypothetical protein
LGGLNVGIDGQLGFLLAPVLWLRFWTQEDLGRSRADRWRNARWKYWLWRQKHGLHSLSSSWFVVRKSALRTFINFMHQLFDIIEFES